MFLVLSDLHFGRDLHLPPELPPLTVSRLARWVGREKETERFFERSCRGHSFATVSMLPRYVKLLLHEAQFDGFGSDGFDLCILLGDQATVPDAQAYKFLRQYITSDHYKTTGDLHCAGLGISSANILAIPGNHDKLLRANLDLYHSEFTAPLGIPRIEPAGSLLMSRTIGRREFLFISVDASVYTAQELTIDVHARDHLARGEVSSQLWSDLKTKLDGVKKGAQVDSAQLVGAYENAVKVVLVHYAVDASRLSQHTKWEEKVLPHSCKGIEEMITELRLKYEINVALHGHLHIPGLYNYKAVQVVAATTATEQKGPNGFFVLKVLDTGEIRAEHHCWTGTRFTADPDNSLNKQLMVFPHGAAA